MRYRLPLAVTSCSDGPARGGSSAAEDHGGSTAGDDGESPSTETSERQDISSGTDGSGEYGATYQSHAPALSQMILPYPRPRSCT